MFLYNSHSPHLKAITYIMFLSLNLCYSLIKVRLMEKHRNYSESKCHKPCSMFSSELGEMFYHELRLIPSMPPSYSAEMKYHVTDTAYF